MQNIFTVDLEDWYCSPSLARAVPRSSWSTVESRAHIGTRELLAMLRRHDVRATFFVLGCVAERNADLVREVAGHGHEVASHGYAHEHLETLDPVRFSQDLDRCSEVIERITGRPPTGYRAPMFSLTRQTVGWAPEILRQHAIAYDSSIYPMRWHPSYGMRRAPLWPHRLSNGLREFPIGCAEIAGVRVPCGGGAYFRQFPYRLSSALIRHCNQNGRPLMFYIHPWELDAKQPRMPVSVLSRIRHYRGLSTMAAKLDRLLSEFSFTSVHSFLRDVAD